MYTTLEKRKCKKAGGFMNIESRLNSQRHLNGGCCVFLLAADREKEIRERHHSH